MKELKNGIDLCDDLKLRGSSLNLFKDRAEKFDAATSIEKVAADCSTVLYCYNQIINKDKVVSKCHVLYDECICAEPNGQILLETQNLESPTSKLIGELKNNVLLNFDMNYVDMSGSYFLSDFARRTLAKSMGAKVAFLKKDSEMNALFIASALNSLGEEATIVSRTDGAYKKIFAVVGNKYKRLSLMEMAEVAELLKDPFKIERWEITHNMSEIMFSYGENFEIALQTSDTCYISDAIRVYYKINGETFYMGAVDFPKSEDRARLTKTLVSFITGIEKKIEKLETSTKREVVQKALAEALGAKLAKVLAERTDFKDILFNIHNVLDLSPNQLKEYKKAYAELIA